MENTERKLYAVAIEIPIKRRGQIIGWEPDIVHIHAFDSQSARVAYMSDSVHREHRVVAVGPVIGYHVEDEHGEVLRA